MAVGGGVGSVGAAVAAAAGQDIFNSYALLGHVYLKFLWYYYASRKFLTITKLLAFSRNVAPFDVRMDRTTSDHGCQIAENKGCDRPGEKGPW
jgi:hypothetical protein